MSESAPPPAPRAAVILLAGGRGRRAGFDLPKQLEQLGGKPVLQWSLNAFIAHPAISGGVLVANGDVMAAIGPLPADWLSADTVAEPPQSVGTDLVAPDERGNAAFLLVHDARRPGVGTALHDRLLAPPPTADAPTPTLPGPTTPLHH